MEHTTFHTSIAACCVPSAKDPVLLAGAYEQSLVTAKKLGYEAIEIHVGDPKKIDLASLKAALKQTDMKISGIATGIAYADEGLCLIHPDAAVRAAAVQRLREFCTFAAELDSVLLIGRMKGDINDMSRYEQYEQILADGLGQVAQYAQSVGTAFELEAINRYESNYMSRVGQIGDFIRKYRLPATRILMDIFHMNIEEADICASIRSEYALLGYFHIADSNRLYPGQGHTDIGAALSTLTQLGYDGYVSLECLPKPDGITAATRAMDYIRTHLDKE